MVVARVVLPGWGLLEVESFGQKRYTDEVERDPTGSRDAGDGY